MMPKPLIFQVLCVCKVIAYFMKCAEQPEKRGNESLRRYHISLHSSVLLRSSKSIFHTECIKTFLSKHFATLDEHGKYARQQDKNYSAVTNYVADVDYFVFELQRFSEQNGFWAYRCFFRYVVNGYGVYVTVHTARSCEPCI